MRSRKTSLLRQKYYGMYKQYNYQEARTQRARAGAAHLGGEFEVVYNSGDLERHWRQLETRQHRWRVPDPPAHTYQKIVFSSESFTVLERTRELGMHGQQTRDVPRCDIRNSNYSWVLLVRWQAGAEANHTKTLRTLKFSQRCVVD